MSLLLGYLGSELLFLWVAVRMECGWVRLVGAREGEVCFTARGLAWSWKMMRTEEKK